MRPGKQSWPSRGDARVAMGRFAEPWLRRESHGGSIPSLSACFNIVSCGGF